MKKIKSALISVFHKDGLDDILEMLVKFDIKIISTGGTHEYIKSKGIEVEAVENLTSYPSILGGRVKTLHPKIFGGILGRRDKESDMREMEAYDIPEVDLVIVDLYPFEKTIESTEDQSTIIEKIDIGGISLIRAAAKNYRDVLIVPSKNEYANLENLLKEKKGYSDEADRRYLAASAFNVSSHYDTAIFNWFNKEHNIPGFKASFQNANPLRYGENPHQKGTFFGDFGKMFDQVHGKAISYNNLLDIDASVSLIQEFEETTIAILKHNNACGLASRDELSEAWKDALEGDPVSAFGGIIVANRKVDVATAEEMNKIFFEVIIAPEYDENALEILKSKKNRIILVWKEQKTKDTLFRSLLNGVLVQDKDLKTDKKEDFEYATTLKPSDREIDDLVFANKIVKHTKSNAIVLVKNKQLVGSGTGQTSRVDAMQQAIAKANTFELNLDGAVIASDAFFPFNDNVEIAYNAGIRAVIQPGGSIRDKDSVEFCNNHDMSMVFYRNTSF